MRTTLLKTKLYRPTVRPEYVSRSNLLKRLDDGFKGKLTVISAPAGYGKTTLVSAWAAKCGHPVAWLSLDEEDNDPARFLTYVIAAAQTIQPDLGQEILSALQSAQPPAIKNLQTALVNQLDDIQTRFVLVLDDYQVITSQEIHEAIIFILDHQPPRMHLLLTTRSDPPLHLAQLRARGQLTEIRQADLSFSEDETLAFLKQGSGIELPSKDIALLVNRTEGWIASLQMAALSMKNKKDILGFIAGFGGSHGYIVDYFASEILHTLPEATRSFLLKTSFLEQLCGSLCDEITGLRDGQRMLESLQEANLFLVALDDEHTWYRYHQLFADFLQKCLMQDKANDVSELHMRASRWFEQNDLPHQAIEHAFLARDFPRAANLLEDAAYAALGQGEHVWLLKEIEALPDDQMKAHPRMSIMRATILVSTGFVQEAEKALLKTEAVFQNKILYPNTRDYMDGRIAALRAMIAIQLGDVENVACNAQMALKKITQGTQPEASWRANTLIALGLSNFAIGDLDEAVQNLQMAIEEASLADSPYTFLEVTTYLVEVLWIQGQLKEAEKACKEGLKFIEKNKLNKSPMSGEVLLAHCFLLCEGYDLGQAEDFLLRGTELIQNGGAAWAQAWAFQVKMRYLIAKGDLAAAETIVGEAEQLFQLSEMPTWIASGIASLKELVWIRQGKLEEAERYLKQRGIWAGSKIRYSYQRETLSLAALLNAKGEFKSAEVLLDSIAEWAEATKQYRTLICVGTLHAMALAGQKETQKALQSLASAFELAEPEGYHLTILELAGEGIAPLLNEAARQGIHPDYSRRLLKELEGIRVNPLGKLQTPNQKPESATSLRAREIEVLRLAADGQTNKEIAYRLHITVRTVKFHLTSIFTKLGVENRNQAAAKARLLGILQ